MDTGGLALGLIALIVAALIWGTWTGVAAGLAVFAAYYWKQRAT